MRDAEAKSEADRKRESAPGKVSGDDSWRAPPVPIPNTEVKPLSAESTWLETARENRTLPDSKRLRRVISTQSFFCTQISQSFGWYGGKARCVKRSGISQMMRASGRKTVCSEKP